MSRIKQTNDLVQTKMNPVGHTTKWENTLEGSRDPPHNNGTSSETVDRTAYIVHRNSKTFRSNDGSGSPALVSVGFVKMAMHTGSRLGEDGKHVFRLNSAEQTNRPDQRKEKN